jgi:hypothetical protein
VYVDYRHDLLGHLPSPFNIKFNVPLECKPLTTDTDITEPFPPGTSMFIQAKCVSTCAMVMSLIDSSDTSVEYHYYTVNLITGSKRQIYQDAIWKDRYTADNSALKFPLSVIDPAHQFSLKPSTRLTLTTQYGMHHIRRNMMVSGNSTHLRNLHWQNTESSQKLTVQQSR